MEYKRILESVEENLRLKEELKMARNNYNAALEQREEIHAELISVKKELGIMKTEFVLLKSDKDKLDAIREVLGVHQEIPMNGASINGPLNINKMLGSVQGLDITVHGQNLLHMAGIKYIGQLVQISESKLLKERGLGKGTLTSIKIALMKIGLELGIDLPAPLIEEFNYRING